MIILIAFGAFVATMIGGLVALRFKDKLHLILGFSAGAIIAVAFFDLMPEAIDLGGKYYATATVPSIVALGFMTYLVLDRLIFLHAHVHEEGHEHELSAPESRSLGGSSGHIRRGILGASSLSFHSFLDGVAIGLAFQVSASVGAIVAVAVLVHDFSDGINTVNLVLKNQGEGRRAFRWLLVDALAPIVGAASTLLFSLPESALAVILALFSGFFLYIGATDLIPESHHRHPKFLTTAMTLLGAGILYIAIHFANV
jgi:ZIP family zinc transporter